MTRTLAEIDKDINFLKQKDAYNRFISDEDFLEIIDELRAMLEPQGGEG